MPRGAKDMLCAEKLPPGPIGLGPQPAVLLDANL